MSETIINKANSIGSAISTWTKIAIWLVIFIIGIGTTYYKIEGNAADNERQDTQFVTVVEEMHKEFSLWGDRSDKRYKRTINMYKEIHEEGKETRKLLQKTREELYFIKGILHEKNKNK